MEWAHAGVGKMCECKRESETRLCYELTTSHHSHPPRTVFEERMEESFWGKNERLKQSLGRKGDGEEVFYGFPSHYSTPFKWQ